MSKFSKDQIVGLLLLISVALLWAPVSFLGGFRSLANFVILALALYLIFR